MAAPDAKETLVGALCRVASVSSKLENFLSAQPDVANTFKSTTKQLYDFVKQSDNKNNALKGTLAELIVSNFDDEQIWQEVELQNEPLLKRLVKDVAKVKRKGETVSLLPEPESSSEEEEEDVEEDEFNEFEDDEEERTLEDEKDEHEPDEGSESDLDFDIDAFEAKTKQKRSASQANLRKPATKSKIKKRKTEVDDKFFSLADMEEFLVQEDEREERRRDAEEGKMGRDESDDDDDESVDMYADDDDEEEEEGREATYTDFFDPPNYDEDQGTASKSGKQASGRKSVRFEDEMGDEDDGEEEEAEDDGGDYDFEDVPEEEVQFKKAVKMQSSGPRDLLVDSESEGEDAQEILGGKAAKARSNFEKRQEKLKQTISQLEESNLAEKPWQLTGEVKGGSRPENSLLEEVLSFDQTTAQTPVITEETTMALEDIIKQRIKDQAWDDVERKVKPVEEAFEYKKRVLLDQEKSKSSLAQVYEKEYLKQTQDEKKEEENPQHKEIKTMMDSLFVKLDALSNFHFTPKPPAPEVKIISNLPSITHEEVAPTSVSDAALLAPEEVKEKSKSAGQEKGSLERTATDRNRERRQKRVRKRRKLQEKEKKHKLVEKLNPGLGNKYAKKRAMEELEMQSKRGGKTKIIKDEGKSQPLKSSKAFFTQLQEEVSEEVKKARGSKNSKKKKRDTSASKLKL
ncbi:U3 small nucleolar ribonucleoprotein protein MPP10-like [Branchiostoma floridae]|uniref:U3 small nucleolar ribonucleoprotein protein MPP10 n=1 Tax=Branchiostoma floridae TaxID=7739 RepID=A0A9J7KMH6_BRAFL|nr:U3 small nucleolar ribonucleoprotein protein MPP10-like [Branchiostoma floridae]